MATNATTTGGKIMEILPRADNFEITNIIKENRKIIENIIDQNSLILKAMLAPPPAFITGKIEERDE